MPHRRAVQQQIKEYVESEAATWLIGPDWHFITAHGAGFDRIRSQPEHLIGQSALALYQRMGRPDLIAFFGAVMSGAPAATVLEFEGTMWMVDAHPVPLPGGTGVSCLGHVLDRRPVLAVETTAAPVEYVPPETGQVWSAARTVADAHVREGDRWRINGQGRGITQTITRSADEFAEMQACYPDLVHYRGRTPSGADLYVSAGDNATFRVWSGDKWYVTPGAPTVLQSRLRATSEFAEIWASHPDLFTLCRAESPEIARAALRVL